MRDSTRCDVVSAGTDSGVDMRMAVTVQVDLCAQLFSENTQK